jgi:biopolymer transport protein ExbD/biopolymer transport protein TolR
MAMTVGSAGPGKTVAPAMNVTPLIDVVLVLLIIFMVITPLLSKNFWVHLPKQEQEDAAPDEPQDDSHALVLKLGPGRTITVNNTEIPAEELVERLKRMFAARSDHVLFFDATDDVDYGFAVEILDKAREGHAVTIAPLTTSIGQPADAAAGTGAPATEPPPAP